MGIEYSENRIATLAIKGAHLNNILQRHDGYMAMIDWTSMSRQTTDKARGYVKKMRLDIWEIRAEIDHHMEYLRTADIW